MKRKAKLLNFAGKRVKASTARVRKQSYRGTSKKRLSWAANEAAYEQGLVDRYIAFNSMLREWPTLSPQLQAKVLARVAKTHAAAVKKWKKVETVIDVRWYFQRKRGAREA